MKGDHPFATLRSVERALIDADAIPLVGALPSFPIEALTMGLKHLLQTEELSIDVLASRWQQAERAIGEFEMNYLQLNLVAPPLEGESLLLIAREELQSLLGVLLAREDVASAFLGSDLLEGFLHFLALEIARILRAVGYPVLPTPSTGRHAIKGPTLSVDFSMQIKGVTCRFRLLLSKDLTSSLRRRFAPTRTKTISKEIAAQLTIPVHLQVGSVELSFADFNNLSVGDFIALDQCTVDPATGEGRLMLEAAGQPVCLGVLSGGQVELHPL